ncbi:hypothetical protein HDU76_010342, partial [Blyttiomyces sp. JEL0837]
MLGGVGVGGGGGGGAVSSPLSQEVDSEKLGQGGSSNGTSNSTNGVAGRESTISEENDGGGFGQNLSGSGGRVRAKSGSGLTGDKMCGLAGSGDSGGDISDSRVPNVTASRHHPYRRARGPSGTSVSGIAGFVHSGNGSNSGGGGGATVGVTVGVGAGMEGVEIAGLVKGVNGLSGCGGTAGEFEGLTVIDLAADGKEEELVNMMRLYGGDPNQTDERGRTALHFAAAAGHSGVIRRLIEFGADLTAADANGNTALHLAVLSNRLDSVLVLLRAGADVSRLDRYHRTPADLVKSRLKHIASRIATDAREKLITELHQIIDILYFYMVPVTPPERIFPISSPNPSSTEQQQQQQHQQHLQSRGSSMREFNNAGSMSGGGTGDDEIGGGATSDLHASSRRRRSRVGGSGSGATVIDLDLLTAKLLKLSTTRGEEGGGSGGLNVI